MEEDFYPQDEIEVKKISLETEGEKPEVQDYEMRLWAGIKPIYACLKCNVQMDSESKMKVHVLEHSKGRQK